MKGDSEAAHDDGSLQGAVGGGSARVRLILGEHPKRTGSGERQNRRGQKELEAEGEWIEMDEDGYGYECWASGVGCCLRNWGVSVVDGGQEERVLARRRERQRANKTKKKRARAGPAAGMAGGGGSQKQSKPKFRHSLHNLN